MSSTSTHTIHHLPALPLPISCLGLCELCGVLLTDVLVFQVMDVLVFQVMNVTVTINWP
jgi:hypothetical protein